MLDFIFTGVNGSPNTDYSNILTLTLAHEQATLPVAPSSNWFVCSAVSGAATPDKAVDKTYDPKYHEIFYLWDFGDAANAVPTTPLNMPNIWKDTNTAAGNRVAHVFNDAGTYTVTCYAYEHSTRRFGSATIDVTIQDANAYFPGTRTIVYAPNGTSGLTVPSGANVQATWAGAIGARNTFGTSQTARILLAPGATVTFAQSEQINADNWSNARFGALDPNATRPKFSAPDKEGGGQNVAIFRERRENCNENVFYGIEWKGGWNPAIEKGTPCRPIFISSPTHNGDRKAFLAHRCTFEGFDHLTATALAISGKPVYNHYSDCSITSWKDYGIIIGFFQDTVPRGYNAVTGCSLAQNANALSGGTKDDIHNAHGPLRDFGSLHLFISACDMFSRNGWSGGGAQDGRAITGNQPCIRVNTTGHEGCSAYVDRVCAEGTLAISEQDSLNIDPAGNYVFDKVLQVLGSRATSNTVIGTVYGGTTLRNILSIKLNLPEATDPNSNYMSDFISIDSAYASAAGLETPIALHNVTCVDLRNNTNARDDIGIAILRPTEPTELGTGPRHEFDVEIIENNVLYRPNYTGFTNPTGDTANISNFVSGYTPRDMGPRFNFAPQRVVLGATVPIGGTFFVPYSSITDKLVDVDFGTPLGNATTQAYWLENAGIDNRHQIYFKSSETYYYALRGDFSVSFDATGITFTNTSGVSWNSGSTVSISLDRTSRLPAFDPQYSSEGVSLNISVPRPARTAGLAAYNDLWGEERPATGDVMGAI